jgi:methyl-accepting chemotaxis protein
MNSTRESSSAEAGSFRMEDRLAFVGITPETRQQLVKLGKTVAEQMPGALDTFYEHIDRFTETRSKFNTGDVKSRAKTAQLAHWQRICSGQFSTDYAASVQRIGAVHARIGLEPKWYIGAYAFLSAHVIRAITADAEKGAGFFSRKPKTNAAEQIIAFVQAMLLDVELSLNVYFELSEKARLDAEAAQAEASAKAVENAQTAVVATFGRAFSALADRDLTVQLTDEVPPAFEPMRQDFNRAVVALGEVMQTARGISSEVASSAEAIQSGARDLSMRTEQQAASLEETAATTEQLAASVKASAQSSRNAVALANEATGVAQEGGSIVGRAVEAMARIETASQKISDITDVIDEIAFQTNLLALNAAVEAARAGDAGKGFAVVASEVRTLAQRSSEAAKEITALIDASVSEVEGGVKLVRSAGEALDKIVDASRRVAQTVTEISTASGEQANGIESMSESVADMDQMTQQNAALAEESAGSATALTDQVARLNEVVAQFRLSEAATAARLREQAAAAFSRRETGRETAPRPRKVAGGSWESF